MKSRALWRGNAGQRRHHGSRHRVLAWVQVWCGQCCWTGSCLPTTQRVWGTSKPILMCSYWGHQAPTHAFWLPPLVLAAHEQARVVDPTDQVGKSHLTLSPKGTHTAVGACLPSTGLHGVHRGSPSLTHWDIAARGGDEERGMPRSHCSTGGTARASSPRPAESDRLATTNEPNVESSGADAGYGS